MTFRLLIAVMLIFVSRAGLAIDCLSAHEDSDQKGFPEWSISLPKDKAVRAACGSLVVRGWKIDDARPHVSLSAAFVEFSDPASDAERQYNEWVRSRTSRKDAPAASVEDPLAVSIFAIVSLYRSKSLLSARGIDYSVGAHPSIDWESFNFDLVRGVLLKPEELFDMRIIADVC